MAGVLLIAEVSGEQLAATTAELIAEGWRLAKELGGGSVTVLLAGKNIQGLASSLGQLGAEQVLVAESQSSAPPSPQWLLAAAEQAAKQTQPDAILLTHAGGARDLGPSLAYRLNSGMVTDATALRVDGGELVITKPVFGGSAIAEFSISSTPKVVTLRPRAFETDEPPTAREAQVEALAVPDPYITIGISGAVQHIAGISGARNVVAINRDADANIFKYARYGVVGDWKQILPAFTQRLKELRGCGFSACGGGSLDVPGRLRRTSRSSDA